MTSSPARSGLTTATLRAIQALADGHAGRADQIADLLADAIRLGLLTPGERLPSEAALSEQFGVATLTLREALATLRDRGLVTTLRGRAGGSFVTSGSSDPAPHAALARWSVHQLREIGDVRAAVSASAADLAARRAAPSEVAALRQRVANLAAAAPRHRWQADTEFAIAVAVAAQSPHFAQEEARLHAELGDLFWAPTSDGQHAAAVRARGALVDAIARGDAALARSLREEQVATETTVLVHRRIALHTADTADRPRGAPRRSGAAQAWMALADELRGIFAALRRTADAYAASRAAATESYTRADLAALRPRITEMLDQFADLAVGTGIIPAPGVLDDSRYWLEWWWRRAGGAPEALRVNLNPDEPDFFDYPLEEWFELPISARREHIAGPYVDYSCTNLYSVTLAVPVFDLRDSGRALGVVAMDIPCARIEGLVMPALCQMAAPVALVNADGRVIASNTAILPGTRLSVTAGRPPATPGERRLEALTGWRVHPVEGA